MDPALFRSFGFGPAVPTPFELVHHAFEHHVARAPNAPAVEHLEQTITYAQLDAAANRLAHRLRRSGVLPGARVCLLVQRSIAMVIGIMAILKAGGAYVPLDGGIVTDSSLEHVIADSEATVILVQRDFAHRVSSHPHLILEHVIAQDAEENADSTKPVDLSSPRDGVYVIYTSGTTGKPKGVDVMHRNVVNLLCLSPGNIGMKPGLRVAQLLNIAFDMCAWEVLGSLANGCTLCLRGKTSAEWKAVLRTADVVIATPSVLGMHDPADYPNIKFAATAGEACPQSLADKWSRSCQFFNSCGPTEITIVNTVQPHVTGAPLSIGRPTPNNNIYILDDQLRPVPMGEQGIVWAGGLGVTRGYLNLPDKTAERYRLDPFADDGSMMFNTGDIGRWRTDGQLDHLGRADDQVKVKGFRVELDGVAAAMESCDGVKVATAILIGKELWGFYAPSTVSQEDVKRATAKIQPYYAVPTKFLALPSFPHTSNGKSDKRALRSMAENSLLASASAVNERPPVVAQQPPRSVPNDVWRSAPDVTPIRKTPRLAAARAALPSAAVALQLDVAVAELPKTIQLQDCHCEPGLAQEQIHLVPVPIRVQQREPHATRVEVVSISPLDKSATSLSSHYSALNGFSWSQSNWHGAATAHFPKYATTTRDATCALVVVGRDVQSSAPGSVVTKCGRCSGWGHAVSGCCNGSSVVTKETVADVACSLSQDASVDVVCILSDPKTSHAVVNELGHRGVSVVVGVMG